MPFTPFHFGPGAVAGFPLSRRLDPFTFVLASVAVDLEPLAVMTLRLDYPLHGYAHTFLGAALVGMLWGYAVWVCRGILKERLCGRLKIPFQPSRRKMVLSGMFGAWFHVLLDAPLYPEMNPLFPFPGNALYGLVEAGTMYLFCAFCFIPALGLYWRQRRKAVSQN